MKLQLKLLRCFNIKFSVSQLFVMALSSDFPNPGMRFRNKLDSIDEGEGDGKKKESMKELMEDLCQEDNPNNLVYRKVL